MNRAWIGSVVAAVLLVPALAACGSDSNPTTDATTPAAASSSATPATGVAPLPTGGAELVDTSWVLSGASYATGSLADSGITLAFAEAQAGGKATINTYNADYTSASDGTLTFGPIATTRMAGDADQMDAETQYLAALATVTAYTIDGGLLDLFAGPDQILTFVDGD